MISQAWYSHGKLLLTGEYLILHGAKGLALPLKLGQYLSVKKAREPLLKWKAMKPDGAWFQAQFTLDNLELIKTTDSELGNHLKKILHKVIFLNPDFLSIDEGKEVETILEFEPEFGFGSSSTLINNLARWAEVDPYELLELTFGGSGYDIACARADMPLTYQLVENLPLVNSAGFNPPFKEHLYFVYLNKKQVSRQEIKNFRSQAVFTEQDIAAISEITNKLVLEDDLLEFEQLLFEHERIMAKILGKSTVKSELFIDHAGIVKSLGAWGGDYVLMTNRSDPADFEAYLKNKGFQTFYRFDEIVKT